MNLRPSGYEPDELPGCSTPRRFALLVRHVQARGLGSVVALRRRHGPGVDRFERYGVAHIAKGLPSLHMRRCVFLVRSGGDLLSHVLRRSTIGATALNGRVRDGIGCFARAMATRPEKKHAAERVRRHHLFPSPCLLLTCGADCLGFHWIKSSLSSH